MNQTLESPSFRFASPRLVTGDKGIVPELHGQSTLSSRFVLIPGFSLKPFLYMGALKIPPRFFVLLRYRIAVESRFDTNPRPRSGGVVDLSLSLIHI